LLGDYSQLCCEHAEHYGKSSVSVPLYTQLLKAVSQADANSLPGVLKQPCNYKAFFAT
jgi:hypothetical protein